MIIQDNLQRFKAEMSSLSETLEWLEPDAGCVAFPRLQDGMTATDFARRLLEHKGVLVIPGDCFRWRDSHIRLGFGQVVFSKALRRFMDLQTCA